VNKEYPGTPPTPPTTTTHALSLPPLAALLVVLW